MSSKYFREPMIIVEQPGDWTYAFTMRLLNTLSMMGLKIWKNKDESKLLNHQVHVFAMRSQK